MLSSSIIICTKDRGYDLDRCLESLGRQSRQPEQVIVVDSGSDNSRDIVAEYARDHSDVDVIYLRSEPGLTRQRNFGRPASFSAIHRRAYVPSLISSRIRCISSLVCCVTMRGPAV